jgi:hypothetical protein
MLIIIHVVKFGQKFNPLHKFCYGFYIPISAKSVHPEYYYYKQLDRLIKGLTGTNALLGTILKY